VKKRFSILFLLLVLIDDTHGNFHLYPNEELEKFQKLPIEKGEVL